VLVKGDKKVIQGWVMYDWANSAYPLVISSAIFPIFYDEVTKSAYALKYGLDVEKVTSNEVTVDFFGLNVSPTVLFSLVLSASFLVVSFLSPILSGIADYTGSKKKYLKFFCYTGSLACVSLYWFDATFMELSMISIFVATICYWNSLVFYNSFLPEIAPPKDHDRISAKGFSLGYYGSVILLLICLGMIMGVDAKYTPVSFILVGIWWASFSQLTYRVLPNNVYNRKPKLDYIKKGFKELKLVYSEFLQTHRLKRYLQSFFFFNTGVQTVMLMAVLFATKAIEWPEDGQKSGLIISILIIQILASIGAFLMAKLSVKIGNIKTLILSVFLWILICTAAFIVKKENEFYMLAACVGLVMGGVQAIARSTYSKFLPETSDHASYFSFYDVSEKIGIVFGTAFFALAEYLFDDIKYSVISVALFFVIGLVLLYRVPEKEIKIEGKEFLV